MIPTPLRLAFLALLFAGTALRLCAASSPITVTTTLDSGAGSLRQAIIDANASPGNDIIDFNFASGTAPYTITLASALPSIATTSTAGTLTITGLGASSLTISGDNGDSSRNFSILIISSGGNLSISGVTVSGAKSTGEGAFVNAGTLSVTHSTISGNTAGFAGGGIRNFGGNVTVSNSTISANVASYSAGISATGGTTSVNNSTLVGNVATNLGGGIGVFNTATVNLTNSTLSGNSAAADGGGGIYADGGTTLNIANTIIANSTSGGDFAGSGTVNVTSPATAAHNLVSQGTFAWATTKTSAEINLGTLANNGGTTSTLALLTGSVAIGTGNAAISNAAPVSGLDQRGTTRSLTAPSIGAFEGQNPANTPTFGTPTSTANGFTVQISNYDNNFTYGGTATASGTVAISGTGLVTVSGVAANTSSTATITTTRTAYLSGSAQVTATSLAAPGAPTGVSAIAGNAQVTVIFTAPANNGGAAITGYTVTSSPAGGTDTNAGSTSLSHVITGLTNGTAYTFTVTATNSVGTSSASTASSAVTPATPPGAPTSVAAVRGPGEAVVSFTAPVSDGGSAITSYTVTSNPGGVTATGSTSPITITGLTNGTSYTFTVTATNAVGTGSASSASNAITPTAASLAGVNFGATGGVVQVIATAVDTAGNIYLAGHFSGQTTLVLGGVTLTKIGPKDGWLAKLDASRTVVWAKNIGGSGAETFGRGIAVDTAGNVYFSGKFSANLSTPTLNLIGTQDGLVLKFDRTGTITWAKNFGGPGSTSSVEGIAVDAAGNVCLAGYFSAPLTTPALTNVGTQDALALKLDSNGTITWAKGFGGFGASANGESMALDAAGNVYLNGNFTSGDLTTPALAKIGAQDGFAIKLNSSGTTTWAKNFGGSDGSGASITARGLAVDTAGNVYFTGYLLAASLTTPTVAKIGTRDALVLKLDSSGNTTWAKSFGGAGAETTGRGIAVDSSGNVYLGGFFQTASMTTPALALTGPQDAFALKLNSSGNATWAKKFFGSGAFATNASLALDDVGNVYLGGYFSASSMTVPALTLGASADAMLIAAYLPEPSVPGAPTGATATAGNAQATVSFTAPTNTGGIAHTGTVAITGYTVTSSPAGGIDGNAGGTSLSRVMTGLTNGTSYTFTVTATNSVGTGSASSASAAVTPAGNPTITTPTSANVGSTSATLGGNVTASGGASLSAVGVVYAITSANSNPQLNGTGVTNVAGTAATGVFTVNATGLTAGTAYSYAAYATNSQGTSYTSVGTFTTTVPTPTLTFATPSTASVAVGATRTNAVTSTLSGGSYGAISYSSSDTGKATVNPTTGVVTGLAVGTTTITATQAAASGFNATTSTSYTLTVTIGTPTITTAPTASGITYGQTLASSTFIGGAVSVSGTFAFTAPNTQPGVGTAAQGVTFTPTDATNYTSVTTTVNVTVAKATPTISVAPAASGITYGQTLASSTLSGGTASTAGAFTFTTPSTAPNAGTAAQGVTFTPTDTTNYTSVTTTVNVTVAKATPTISVAPTASGITYGQTLASSTLSGGTASTTGAFTFTTPSTAPNAGTAAQGVTFTPTDTTNYISVTTTVNVTVDKATPTILVAPEASGLIYGSTLASYALTGGAASTTGTFTWTTPSTAPNAGTSAQGVTFTPSSPALFNTTTTTVNVTVAKARTAVIWSTPSAITYGTVLSATQLNASGSVAGAIVYSPTSGTTPSAGAQTLTATFTPTDAANYNPATGTVSLVVNKATPTITWATPSTITSGTALSAAQLNATASVAGAFTYSPASGTTPSVGTQTLSATFTPTDTANYNSASASVSLNVIVAVPGSPTAITATTANGEATVTFTAPSNPGSSAITGYTIRATATDGSTVTVNATGSPAKVTGLTPGKSYRFTVTANNSAGSSDTGTTSDGLTISLVNQTISFTAPADRTSNSGSFTLAATSSSGLPVTFTVVSGPALLTGNVLDLTGTAGTVKIRASQAGNATYAAAPEVEVTFAVTAGRTNVVFSQALSSGSSVPAAELGVVLPGNGQPGSLLVVSNVIPTLNGVITFGTTFSGGFTGTLVSSGAAAPLDARIQAAPVTYTITGTLLNGVLTGTIAPLGLVFTAPVPLPTGPSAAAAGLYTATALFSESGTVYSVVGADNKVLVLVKTPTVTAGGLTTLKADGSYTLATTTAPGGATLTGAVNSVTTASTATLTVPGTAPVVFLGLSSTTKRTDRLIGLASRAKVGTGESVLITGVAIGGTDSKRVLIRAGGPALAAFGLGSTLSNPTLKIYRGSTLIAQNDDWNPADAAEMGRLGLFAFPNGSKDAAILTTLAPGSYTAHVSDLSGTGTGVALAEIYDASVNPAAEDQRLVSIASRGTVTVGDGALIGGFVVTGNSPKTLLIRGVGPALTAFGVAGALADPVLTIYDGGEALATNAGWANRAEITTAGTQAGAFALAASSRDAALLVTLKPGSYTAQVKAAQVTSSGVALIEIYEVP